MSAPRIDLDGPYRNRNHQRRVRLQLLALGLAALALVFSPYIAMAIWQLVGTAT